MTTDRVENYYKRKTICRRAKRQLLRWLAGVGVMLVIMATSAVVVFSAGPVLGKRAAPVPTPALQSMVNVSILPYREETK
jgi:hypothetical protein